MTRPRPTSGEPRDGCDGFERSPRAANRRGVANDPDVRVAHAVPAPPLPMGRIRVTAHPDAAPVSRGTDAMAASGVPGPRTGTESLAVRRLELRGQPGPSAPSSHPGHGSPGRRPREPRDGCDGRQRSPRATNRHRVASDPALRVARTSRPLRSFVASGSRLIRGDCVGHLIGPLASRHEPSLGPSLYSADPPCRGRWSSAWASGPKYRSNTSGSPPVLVSLTPSVAAT